MNPRYWDLNCISETFLAGGEHPGLPVNVSKVFPEDHIVEAQPSPARKWAAPGPLASPGGDVARGIGLSASPWEPPAREGAAELGYSVQAQPLGMCLLDEGCWQGWAVREKMSCLKVLLALGKHCVVVLGQVPGSQQLSPLPFWGLRCTGSRGQAGVQGTAQAGVLVTLLRVLLLPGQLRGLQGDTGLGKQAPGAVDLPLHLLTPSCGGRIFCSCNGCICFYPHGFLLFFLLCHCNWQTWICCLCPFLVCSSVTSPPAGGAMRSPGPAA